MSLIIFILYVILLFDYLKIKDRVVRLEKLSLADKKNLSPEILTLTPIPPPPIYHNRLTPFPAAASEPDSFTPIGASNHEYQEWFFVRWFREDVLIKIGGVFFFLGIAWFVTYAVKSGWLSPSLRITLVLVLALGFYAFGYYRQVASLNHYLVLTALGTGIVCTTVFAAQIVFSLFSPMASLTLLSFGIGYTIYVSLLTKTRWLLLVATLAGLAAPLLADITDQIIPILSYLFVLSATLLLSGYKVNYKPVILLLTIGVLFYENLLLNVDSLNWLWFFVILFSILFFVSVTFSLLQQRKPEVIDILIMLIVGINFLVNATALSSHSSIAVFVAALVSGGVGYYLAERQLPNRVISIYSALATGLVIVGTSLLFSGYSLMLAYIVEFTAGFLLVTYHGLPKLVVWTSALLFLLPLLGSLPLFQSPSWQEGLWHKDAWVLYAMAASLIGSALWLMHKKTVAIYRWSIAIAATFGVVGFLYFCGVLMVVAYSLFIDAEAVVMTYVSWGLLSLCMVFYSLRKNLPLVVTYYAALSVLFPTLVSLESFFSPNWSLGFSHPDGLAVLGILAIILMITLLLVQQFCKEYDPLLRRFVGGFLFLLVGYLFSIFFFYWHGVLSPAPATVAIYTSFAAVLYGFTSLFVMLRTSVVWLGSPLLALVLPIALSFSSFSFIGFTGGVMAPEAVGLFALCVFFALLALGLRRHYAGAHLNDQSLVFKWSKILFGLAFIYIVLFTWCIAHTIVDSTQAISLSLFIYSVAGLFAYQYGKRKEKSYATYAGVSLLTFVVMHLVLVDIWKMELIWQVITFLGIGTMFIATALFETRFFKPKNLK